MARLRSLLDRHAELTARVPKLSGAEWAELGRLQKIADVWKRLHETTAERKEMERLAKL